MPIDCDTFKHPYLNRITVEKSVKCGAKGSRTDFEEGGVLVSIDDPLCKRFKNGKYEVFIAEEIVEHLYYLLHPEKLKRR